MHSIVALVPARSGSKRIKDKNIRPLAGKPLMAHTIWAAQASGMFTDVIVSTDSEEYAEIAKKYMARVIMRPKEIAQEYSTDVEWVTHALQELMPSHDSAFSILRPTNPFRGEGTIEKACRLFEAAKPPVDSLRAMQLCKEHPAKMWVSQGQIVAPILPYCTNMIPWHDTPYQSLPRIYAQTASLEVAWWDTVVRTLTISGDRVMPFFTEGWDGFDINSEQDFLFAEYLIEKGIIKL